MLSRHTIISILSKNYNNKIYCLQKNININPYEYVYIERKNYFGEFSRKETYYFISQIMI